MWHHRTTRARYLKPTPKEKKISKDRRTGTRRGCGGTTDPGVTQKPNNHPKGIRNQTPQKLDNSLKVIWNLVTKKIQSQWPRGLPLSTQIRINSSNQPIIATCQWNISRFPTTSPTFLLNFMCQLKFRENWMSLHIMLAIYPSSMNVILRK